MNQFDPVCAGLDVYLVGGAVRDELLGLKVQDHDYVVVGATPEQMLARGFTAVGQDFPVFLHPKHHAEYALARTERKTGAGYKGFSCYSAQDVTLEQDLSRRDLTINAIAKASDGSLIDPYGGVADLQAGILRHVSPAFAEDPVRILRIARFAARYAHAPREFQIADETLLLMKQMVAAGEVDALVAERVWQEFAKGLLEIRPGRMLMVLQSCGALTRLLPESLDFPATSSVHEADQQIADLARLLDFSAQQQANLNQRFALMLYGLVIATATISAQQPVSKASLQHAQDCCHHLRCPAEARDLALLYLRQAQVLAQARLSDSHAQANLMVGLFNACDAWRRPQRMLELLEIADLHGQFLALSRDADYTRLDYWRSALAQALTIKGGAVAAAYAGNPEAARLIPEALRLARIHAIVQVL